MSDENDLAEAKLRERSETIHVVAQVFIVALAMALVYFALDLAFKKLGKGTEIKASDVVAVLGAVTTFLGTAIGLFFGLSAGQAGKKTADQAAQAAQNAAKTSASVALRAHDLSDKSLAVAKLAEESASRADAFGARMQSARTGHRVGARSLAVMADDVVPTQAEVVDVGIALDSENTTARAARVFLPGSDDDIASNARPEGAVRRQVVGSGFDVVIEVMGEPDDVGVFRVSNAIPSRIRLKVSDGPVAVQPLIVTG